MSQTVEIVSEDSFKLFVGEPSGIQAILLAPGVY
jgi:hypothetical protein